MKRVEDKERRVVNVDVADDKKGERTERCEADRRGKRALHKANNQGLAP